jgi:hypothetical protein
MRRRRDYAKSALHLSIGLHPQEWGSSHCLATGTRAIRARTSATPMSSDGFVKRRNSVIDVTSRETSFG